LVLLRAAAERGGLKLTATGNLSRTVVAEMIDLFAWPDFDKAEAFWMHKVINEPDFPPLFFVRSLALGAKLLRKHKGLLKVAPIGRQVIEAHQPGLQAGLVHMAFWQIDLRYFFGLDRLGGWPQWDMGIILWCLSVAANDWESPHRLTRLCTIPIDGVFGGQLDVGTWAMEAQILRPLTWFGLMEHREEKRLDKPHLYHDFYRKTALFDRFISFDVELKGPSGPRH
jgi:hypothetical protein